MKKEYIKPLQQLTIITPQILLSGSSTNKMYFSTSNEEENTIDYEEDIW